MRFALADAVLLRQHTDHENNDENSRQATRRAVREFDRLRMVLHQVAGHNFTLAARPMLTAAGARAPTCMGTRRTESRTGYRPVQKRKISS